MKRILLLLAVLVISGRALGVSGFESLKLRQTLLRGPLRECLCKDFPLEVREKFQRVVVSDIETRFAHLKSDNVVLASYASGGLLREYLILDALRKKGFSGITLLAIDPVYFNSKDIPGEKTRAANQAIEFFNSKGSELGWWILGLPSVDSFLRFLEDEGAAFKAHVILDIDSNVFSLPGQEDFEKLVASGTSDDGVAYSLRSEILKVGQPPTNTGSLTIPGFPRLSLPGFPDLDSGLDSLPFHLQNLIFEYAR